MSTKQNPGEYDCYTNLEDDEPYLLLMGRSRKTPLLARLYALLLEMDVEAGTAGVDDLMKAADVRQLAYQCQRYRHTREAIISSRQYELNIDTHGESDATGALLPTHTEERRDPTTGLRVSDYTLRAEAEQAFDRLASATDAKA